jgi:hypothetical protein
VYNTGVTIPALPAALTIHAGVKPSRYVIPVALGLSIILAGVLSGCAPDSPAALDTSDGTAAYHDYLGQKPPGLKPEIFVPGIVSIPRFNEYSGTFSPDHTEYYFYRFSSTTLSILLFSRLVNGKWTAPEECAFSRGYGASEPLLTSDSRRLYFMWNRPVEQGQPGYGQNIKYYFVERTADGWSTPRYAGPGMFMSSDRDGRLFVTDISSLPVDGRSYLSRVTTSDGLFTGFETLNIQPYFGRQAHPCIAPDGSYILFDVTDGSHLFISFRKPDGSWGEAIDLAKHGFDLKAGGATISPDGHYLFFSLSGDMWWVDIKVIETLRPG